MKCGEKEEDIERLRNFDFFWQTAIVISSRTTRISNSRQRRRIFCFKITMMNASLVIVELI